MLPIQVFEAEMLVKRRVQELVDEPLERRLLRMASQSDSAPRRRSPRRWVLGLWSMSRGLVAPGQPE